MDKSSDHRRISPLCYDSTHVLLRPTKNSPLCQDSSVTTSHVPECTQIADTPVYEVQETPFYSPSKHTPRTPSSNTRSIIDEDSGFMTPLSEPCLDTPKRNILQPQEL